MPINDNESFELEYDVYVENYEATKKWQPLHMISVAINTSTSGTNGQVSSTQSYSIALTADGSLDVYSNLGYPQSSSITKTDNFSKYESSDAWIGEEHRVKIEINKINSTNFEAKYYVDGDLIGIWNTSMINDKNWQNLSFDKVCANLGFTFGCNSPNTTFKMAIDNLRIKLPNGTVMEEDFEDNDWNRIFGYCPPINEKRKYRIDPAPNQPVKTPIPISVLVLTLTIIPIVLLRNKKS
ncbi:hypothetical protein [Methanotorris formicicus]|uniref:hypothetical protein n=1 Tax=Methanotorris formicicus TaxID=213185 RepID=UPI001145EAE2|nr:hypothetical protein [Methanotorris formicicus]